jgi:hypothetical protein
MKTFCYLIVYAMLAGFPTYSQGVSYKFRIRFSDYSPLSNSKFILSGSLLSTDPQGIIKSRYSDEVSYVNIESADVQKYKIMYPVEGRAILPKDANTFVDIYVAKPESNPLKSLQSEIIASQRSMQNKAVVKLQEESRKGYDRIVALLNKSTIDETQLAKGRLEFFPLISTALNNYLNEARNFNDAFSSLGKTLNNRGSYDQLSKAIYNYNDIFNLLNANKDVYQQAIATYWNSKELALKFSNVVDFSIEELHRPFILEVNYHFIKRIYEANDETNKKDRLKLQKVLSYDMDQLSSTMSRRLLSIGERITVLNSLLNQ